MKKTLLIAILCTAALPAFSQTFSARYGRPGQRPPAPTVEPAGEGAIQRAVRKGNPLQLINPLAPRGVGGGESMVEYSSPTEDLPGQERHNPQSRPLGVRLLSLYFW